MPDSSNTIPGSVFEHWAGLNDDGLTREQLSHFAEHGWLVLEKVLSTTECTEYIDALEACFGLLDHSSEALGYPGRQIQSPACHSAFFLKWFKIPGLLAAHRQIIGMNEIRLGDQKAVTNVPHPGRRSDAERLRDWTGWDWHRDFMPKWGLRRDDADTDLINSLSVTSATFLTPASPEHGSTALLDASHLEDGTKPALGDGSRIVRITAAPGSIILFSECLWHATVPVFAEEPRYVLFSWMTAPWLALDPEMSMSPLPYASRLADSEIRSLFSAPRPLDFGGLPKDG